MWRTAPALLLPACLWIGPADHQTRKDELAIALDLVDLVPDAWSTCVSDRPEFTVELSVSSFHAGGTFDVWFEVEGDTRRELGAIDASGDLGGVVTLTAVLDLTDTLEGADCVGRACVLPLTLGVSRLGVSDQIETEVVVVDSVTPTLVEAWLVDRGGDPTPLSDIPRATNPALGVPATDWPLLRFELADPYQPAGLGGATRVALCPEGVDPTVAPGDCVFAATTTREDLVQSGDMVFEAATADLQGAACAPVALGLPWQLHALVEDHVCAPTYDYLLDAQPLRLVKPDCDGDGSEAPADCDDDDPTRSPNLAETWYDGVDTDCSGGSDYDQDADGADSDAWGGLDCDDLDPFRNPSAIEICDGRDNDCDEVLATDRVTLMSLAGAANFDDLQDAVDSAQAGEEIVICPGTYDGNWVVDVNLGMRGSSGDPADTVLRSATPGQSVLRIGASPPTLDVSVAALTLTGAVSAPAGGGLQAFGAATLRLEDLVLEGNDATRGGGLAVAGDVTIARTTIQGNNADAGGGVAIDPFSSVVFEACVVTGNDALDGGGLHVDRAEVTLDADTEVADNVVGGEGGGLLVLGSSTIDGGGRVRANQAGDGGGLSFVLAATDAASAIDLQVIDNLASDAGGGLVITGGGGSVDLETVLIRDNTASGSGGGLFVGSTEVDPVGLTADGLVFETNSALIDGGGLSASNAVVELVGGSFTGNAANRGGGIHADATELTLGRLVDGVDLATNTATANGGGVHLTGASTLVTSASRFEENTANRGAGLYLDGGTSELGGGAVLANASTGDGGGLYLTGGAVATLLAPIEVSGNTAGGDPQGAFVDDLELEACMGTDVQDPVTNSLGVDQGVTECFLVQGAGFPVECDC